MIDVTRKELDSIIDELVRKTERRVAFNGKRDIATTETEAVRLIVGYAQDLRCAMDTIMADAIEKGVGRYNPDSGLFELVAFDEGWKFRK